MSTSSPITSRAASLVAKRPRALAALLMAAFAGFAINASAASFQCTGKLSASEKIACHDATVSAMDDHLAASYQRAKEASLDTRSLESARTQQWLWRQHNCTDTQCVRSWYERRIAELDADYRQAKNEQHEVFEASLTDQKLAPSAADAVRKIKETSVTAAAANSVTTQ